MRLFSFSIADDWGRGDYFIDLTSSSRIELESRLEALANDEASGFSIDMAKWQKRAKKSDPQRHAVELEGLAAVDGALVIGVRYPSTPQGALLLELDPTTEALRVLGPIDLGQGRTVSALAYDPERGELFVGANPPRKEPAATGKSRLLVFSMPGRGEIGSEPIRSYGDEVEEGLKLEGVAWDGKELWLAFEGDFEGVAQSVLRKSKHTQVR